MGRSHPVSVEVREFDWDSSRKGASQLSRTKTIRLSTPKTTTGEILMFALTSPLIVAVPIDNIFSFSTNHVPTLTQKPYTTDSTLKYRSTVSRYGS